MGTLRTPSLGKLLSLLGYDGTDFSVLKCDSSGRLLALVGYDGSTYRPIATDANGQPKVLISGTVPDADKLDGYHAADFLKLAGGDDDRQDHPRR